MRVELARVLAFHPQDRSCDVQLVCDGSRYTAVPVLCDMFTTSSGVVDLHEPEGNVVNKPGSATRDVVAVLGFAGSNPLAFGFLAPQVSEMLFERTNFRIDRHASDVYETIDKNGNVEFCHPSGTFVRFAEDPEHEDLTAQDFDQRFKITRNTTRAPWLSMMIKNAGVEKARVRIDPSGNVTLTHVGNLTSHTGGNATVQIDGTLGATVNGDTTLTTPNLTINGAVAIVGSSLTHNGVNVGSTHKHGGITAGADNTEVPH